MRQLVAMVRALLLIMLSLSLSGCIIPSERLSFPAAPLTRDDRGWHFDVNSDGKAEFHLLKDARGRFDLLVYDDDQDGKPDRTYRLSDYPPDSVPHVVLALDSIPYRTVAEGHKRGDWPWFAPPAKVIPPFPSMSGVIFTDIFQSPSLAGMVNRHFDRRAGEMENQIFTRVMGKKNPWHLRMHYMAEYWQNGLAFLKPRPWFAAEMARAKRAADHSPDRVTLLYVASSSGMVSQLGEVGVQETLDAVTPFCMQLFYERRGAVKISVLADHGHNYRPAHRVDIKRIIRECGYHPSATLKHDLDVVPDVDGLVNYAGLHTRTPGPLAAKLATRPETQVVAYFKDEAVSVLDEHGVAIVDHRDGKYRYRALTRDVLKLVPAVERMAHSGKTDADGFISAEDWLAATADLEFPDAPYRLWRAFHDLVQNPPDIMIALRDDYCIGLESLQWFIDMRSTHGGLDQINSTTFLLEMTDRQRSPMRSRDVLPTILPGYQPHVVHEP